MEKAIDTRTKLLTKNPFSLMLELSIPAILGMVVVGLYNMMDSIFIGQMVGAAQMGAVSVSYPFTLINAGSAAMLALAFLEDSGYMARVAYVMEGIMSKLGLSGRAFIPMILGFGCTVPAIMASRTLENKHDRFKVMLITPFMSCSARLPIYILFALLWRILCNECI